VRKFLFLCVRANLCEIIANELSLEKHEQTTLEVYIGSSFFLTVNYSLSIYLISCTFQFISRCRVVISTIAFLLLCENHRGHVNREKGLLLLLSIKKIDNCNFYHSYFTISFTGSVAQVPDRHDEIVKPSGIVSNDY
jgi:hypothetical protein